MMFSTSILLGEEEKAELPGELPGELSTRPLQLSCYNFNTEPLCKSRDIACLVGRKKKTKRYCPSNVKKKQR